MNDIRQDNLLFKIFPIFTHPYILIMRLDRPIGFILLFYPICFSIVAFSDLNLKIVTLLIIFFIGSIVMRSAGCIINDLLDRDIDNKVYRTQTRPLVSNALSIKNSIICLIALLSIGLFVLLQLNLPSIILALVIIPLVFLYPLAKRYFFLPQFVLAFTYNWGCLIGWSSLESPSRFTEILLLFFSLVLWTITYDTVYATQDEDDDKKLSLNSSALLFGKYKMVILNFLIVLMYSLLMLFGKNLGFNFLFFIFLTLQLILNLTDLNYIWKNDPLKSGSYFKRNNYYGIFLLLSIIIGSHFNV
ncbi:4-hydroxybenzoate octaprenyltransferase [Alphaproteobacteria bacterium]|nr:4-hydroxybenzoate octaprenyltransferase [Alphaproteobacteria bacterium]